MKLNGLLVPASLHAALVGGSAVLAPAEKDALCALVGAPPDDPWVALCGEVWIERENAAWADPETTSAYRGSPIDIDGPGDVDHRRAILIGFAGSDSPIVLDFRTEPPCVLFLPEAGPALWRRLAPSYETLRDVLLTRGHEDR